MDKSLLRAIPKVDELLASELLCRANVPAVLLTEAVRETLDSLRSKLLSGEADAIPETEELCAKVLALVRERTLPSLRGVINATGVVLHTNLGRACLSERAARAAADAAKDYSTLEYNVETGGRGIRYVHVESLLTRLTGAESALVVNNNASAVLLILSALAQGGEVITSRGELVEIGGSFRVPDIMESCGAVLREVGTTNKTKISDYEKAVGENTRALLKVHTSNFRIVGFTESVEREALTALGEKAGLPVIEDLGSGCFVDLNRFGIRGEPTVQESVRAGIDVLSFSGDKLLGGPQAGIIVGKKKYLDILKKHPLNRAVRVDKMTLAALEMTLRAYAEGTAMEEIPTLSMLAQTEEELRMKATALCARLTAAGVAAEVVPESDQVGGGSVPTQLLPTFAVAVSPKNCSVDALEEKLRRRARPIIGRIAHERYLLDARTIRFEDFDEIAAAVGESAV